MTIQEARDAYAANIDRWAGVRGTLGCNPIAQAAANHLRLCEDALGAEGLAVAEPFARPAIVGRLPTGPSAGGRLFYAEDNAAFLAGHAANLALIDGVDRVTVGHVAAAAMMLLLPGCATSTLGQPCRWTLALEPRVIATVPLRSGEFMPAAQLVLRPVCVSKRVLVR